MIPVTQVSYYAEQEIAHSIVCAFFITITIINDSVM